MLLKIIVYTIVVYTIIYYICTMKTILHKANDRGSADYGWLKTNYSFSFSQYYNPDKIHFGMLRVLNDDIVDAGMGFGTHPHDNMEIITIPLKGSLQHKDSMGNLSIIKANEVQVMSAGKGIQHSEFNPSHTEAVELFQIWIFPHTKNVEPRYGQKEFLENNRINQWQLLVSPEKNENNLWIHQNALISRIKMDEKKDITYKLNNSGNGMYLMVIEGSIEMEEHLLEKRDAIGISETEQIKIKSEGTADLLMIEVPIK